MKCVQLEGHDMRSNKNDSGTENSYPSLSYVRINCMLINVLNYAYTFKGTRYILVKESKITID